MKLFSSKKWSDEQVVQFIQSGGKSREKATQYLLKTHLNYIYKLHHQLGVEKEAARDALVDAVDHTHQGKARDRTGDYRHIKYDW